MSASKKVHPISELSEVGSFSVILPGALPKMKSTESTMQARNDSPDHDHKEGEKSDAETNTDAKSESIGKRFFRYGNSVFRRSDTIVSFEDEDGGDASLLIYMRQLSGEEDIKLEVIQQILDSGVDVNHVSQSTGECAMHEVAANWDITVADYLLKKGANIHLKDCSGKTPLHIAAITDHSEMLAWLIEHGAELEARDLQNRTPLHLAASSDSLLALQVLIECGGNYEATDQKGRTPLYLAAEFDRSTVAEYLISLSEPAEVRVRDNDGNFALTSMIRTMPRVAQLALDQLHVIAPAKRKQYFLLSCLEPDFETIASKGFMKTPFEVAVEHKRLNIFTHPVMRTLIAEKWKIIRWQFYINLVVYFIFLIAWSLLIAFPSVQEKHMYTFPVDVWRIIVEFIAISTYIYQVVEEILEAIISITKHQKFKKGRIKALQEDLENIDTHLIEERQFLCHEIAKLSKSKPPYFSDLWNYLDIATYFLIFILTALHIADITAHSTTLALWTARVSCFVIIPIWVRLFKYARGFHTLGALVAIIGQLIGDILRYFVLFAIIFVPYVVCFWVLFGGVQSSGLTEENREDLTQFHRVAIMVFRIGLIDDYPYSSLRIIDEAMAAILVTSFLFFLAVVGLNLFIALLSDTFQRVYDNAVAVALMQEAQLINSYEERACPCIHFYSLQHIHKKCNPLSTFYDDDDFKRPLEEEKKITHQIHSIVSELQSNSESRLKLDELIEVLTDNISKQDSNIKQIMQQLKEIMNQLPHGRSASDAPTPLAPLQPPHYHPSSSETNTETNRGSSIRTLVNYYNWRSKQPSSRSQLPHLGRFPSNPGFVKKPFLSPTHQFMSVENNDDGAQVSRRRAKRMNLEDEWIKKYSKREHRRKE